MLGSIFYLSGLSLRNTAKSLYFLHLIKISHVSIWNWIQKYKPKKISNKKKKKDIDEYIIYETAIKVGSELIWLWVVIEPKDKEILSFHISKECNMFVARTFSFIYCKRIWRTSCFNRRWWYVVSTKHADF